MTASKVATTSRRLVARRLRANATDAEVQLWKMLRQLPASGTHFRRQVPIGPFVADFACLALRLVIEIDGSQHAQGSRATRDEARSKWLEREGFKVIRFWNNDIVEDREGVLNSIYAAMYGSIDSEVVRLKHERRRKPTKNANHPTPVRVAHRPSPSRGG
ncbi:MAG: endonuclease domain-containing protein [Xanthobacteraceae bacterium]